MVWISLRLGRRHPAGIAVPTTLGTGRGGGVGPATSPAGAPPGGRILRAEYASTGPGDDEPRLVRDHHQLRAVAQPELGQDAAHVRLCGRRADDEPARDLGIR